MIFTDQLNYKIELSAVPKRIISIVPSQTELLHYLGLEDEVIGITKFCIYPNQWFKNKNKIGGTKKLNIEKIKLLKPDLIIGNKEENTEQEIKELQKDFPVWMSDIYNLNDSINMIDSIGKIVDKEEKALQLISEIKSGFEKLKDNKFKNQRIIYLIWNDPIIAVGKNTFIDELILKSGFMNAIDEKRYPEINFDTIQKLKPDFLFLSSEPFPFDEKYLSIYQEKLPTQKIILVDGEMFSWYGNRLLNSIEYFKNLPNKLFI